MILMTVILTIYILYIEARFNKHIDIIVNGLAACSYVVTGFEDLDNITD